MLGRRFDRLFITFWITALLLGLAFWTAVIYVAHHFIQKFW